MKDYQTIYLDSDEDVAAVVGHLAASEARSIVLVFPDNSDIFDSIVNFQLLKREAASLNKDVFIATSDKAGRQLVQRAGISLADAPELKKNKEKVLNNKPAEQILDSEQATARRPAVVNLKNPAEFRAVMDIVAPGEKIISLKKRRQPEARAVASPQKDLSLSQKESTSREKIVEEYKRQLQEAEAEISAPPKTKIQEGPPPKTYQILERFQPIQRDERVDERKKKTLFSVGRIKKILIAFLVAGLFVMGAVFYYVLPRANLIITAKKEQLSWKITVIADKNVNKADPSLNKIPAQVIKTEQREAKEFAATGERYFEEKARGIIAVYNAYSSSPQILVKTTRFISAETGKLFRTTNTVTIPGARVEDGKIIASSVDVEVVADEPGSDYNIGSSNFTIPGFKGSPKYEGFYGKSNSAMQGGAVGKKKVVLEEDLENAKKILIDELKQKLDQDFKAQLPVGVKVLDGAIKEGAPEISFSHQAGAPTEQFRVEGKIQTIAVVFDEKYINELADLKTSSLKDQGKKLASGSQKIEYNDWQIDFNKGLMKLDIIVNQDAVWEINSLNLKESLRGKDETEIRKILSQTPGIQGAKVTFWPFWVKRIPTKTDGIEITME